MANYTQYPQGFWPPPPFFPFPHQVPLVNQNGLNQQAQTMEAFSQNQSLPVQHLQDMGKNNPQYADFLQQFTTAGPFPPPLLGRDGMPLPPPPPIPPIGYDPTQHPGPFSAHHSRPLPQPPAIRADVESRFNMSNPRISEIQTIDKEDGEVSEAEQPSQRSQVNVSRPTSKEAFRSRRSPLVNSNPATSPKDVATAEPPGNSVSHATSFLHNRPSIKMSTVNSRSVSQNGPVHISPADDSDDSLTIPRHRAKTFLQTMHFNGIKRQALTKEGLNAGILEELYQELGIKEPIEQASRLVSAITNEATREVSSSLDNQEGPLASLSKGSVQSVPTKVASVPSPITETSLSEPAPSTRPQVGTSTLVTALETKSPVAASPTTDRSAYIARLLAARSKQSGTGAHAAPPSKAGMTPAISTTSTPLLQQSKQESLSEPSPVVPKAMPVDQSYKTTHGSIVLEGPRQPSSEAAAVSTTAETVENLAIPTESGEAERKKQYQNELLRKKIAALQASKLAKNALAPAGASTEVVRSASAGLPTSLKQNALPEATFTDADSSEMKPSVEMMIPQQPRLPSAPQANDAAYVAERVTISIPGLSASSVQPMPSDRHKVPENVSPAPVNARKKRPVASDFDETPSTSSSGSVKRPFGLSRQSLSHEAMIIEVSDDEAGMDIDDDSEQPDPEYFYAGMRSSSIPALRSMPPLTDLGPRPVPKAFTPSLPTSGLSTPQIQTPGGSSKPYANLTDHEKAIEDLRRKIAEAEERKKAKKPGLSAMSASLDLSAVKPAIAPAEKSSANNQHSIPDLAMHTQVSSKEIGPITPQTAIREAISPPMPASPLVLDREKIDWRQRRRMQIQSKLQEAEARRIKMEEMQRELALLQAQSKKELENKDQLLKELESLGLETEGMSHEALQATKDVIIEQQPDIFDNKTDAFSQQTPSHQPESTCTATCGNMPAAQALQSLADSALKTRSAMGTSSVRTDGLHTIQGDLTGEGHPGVPAVPDAKASAVLSDGELIEDSKSVAQTQVLPAQSNDVADEINDERDNEMDEYSPDPDISVVQHRPADLDESDDGESDDGTVSDVYDNVPEAIPVKSTQIPVEVEVYTGYNSSDDGEDDDFYSPELTLDAGTKGKGNEASVTEQADHLDDYLGDMTPMSVNGNDKDVNTAEDDDRMSTSSGSDDYEPSSIPHPDTTPAEQDGPNTHGTILSVGAPSGATRDQDSVAELDDDDDMEYEPAEVLPETVGSQSPATSGSDVPTTSDSDASHSTSDSHRIEQAQEAEAVGQLLATNVTSAASQVANAQASVGQLAVVRPPAPAYTGSFQPYQSALRSFKAYRYHPNYAEDVSGGFKSLTYSHQIDASKPLCRFEAMGGTCNDETCEDQHFRSMGITDDVILVQLGATNPGQTEADKTRWTSGLRDVLKELRLRHTRDPNVVAMAIAKYRREFLQDPSRVLNINVDS